MARDYSSRHDGSQNGNGKRKAGKRPAAAARPVRQKKKPSSGKKPARNGGSRKRGASTVGSGAPGCIWLLCGVFLAVAGASVYYIASRPAGHGPESVSIDLPNGEPAHSEPVQDGDDAGAIDAGNASTGPTEDKNKAEPRFSFYKMLPNYEVEVPAGQHAEQPVSDDNAPHEAEPAATNTSALAPAPSSAPPADAGRAEPDNPPPQPADQGATGPGYVIQAGAFSREDDADRRKARLALLGVSSDIVDVQTASGKTIYRVQSNVFASNDKAHSLARRLQSHGIETMVRQAD
ncbi:SPOR domain-containing protein [Salinisphaera sp.]|uniref:SPOR domain-containing protein n=1 Tax=Salinisphaera sp. TaxID=1914330 RepID=UPI002D79A022|nr:SPOR domain-containing protein [Salinisphaera sp.]HET7314155.1 SPOR domain-containing protein [Salinisphaera sp.]